MDAYSNDAWHDALGDAGGQSTILSGPREVDLDAVGRAVLNAKRFKMLRAAISDDAWLARVPVEILVGVVDGLRGFYTTKDLTWLERLAQRTAATQLPISMMGRSSIFADKIRHYRK
jgi:hypothetical protein